MKKLRSDKRRRSGQGLQLLQAAAGVGVLLLLEYGFSVAAGHKRFSPALLTARTALLLGFFRPWVQTHVRPRREKLRNAIHQHIGRRS
jgi:hypothetical protein